ncbi:5-methylcytosine restriction system specificity protein McrC [Mycoplasmopsis edwardii]|nr:hypothetical protein [Mycoplasmopsis edwardii]
MIKNKTIKLIEHQKVTKNFFIQNLGNDGDKLFESFKDFVKNIESDDNYKHFPDLKNFMRIEYNKTGGENVRIFNYVGMVQLQNGLRIEILPKLYGYNDIDDNKAKLIFEKMLNQVIDSKSISLSKSSQKTEKMSIYETFISKYLDGIKDIIKKGIKRNYIEIKSNETFLKGKLLLKEHIINNYALAKRFFVSYDEYDLNNPKNMIIKATLLKLKNITTSIVNKNDINTLLKIFKDVKVSKNFEKDYKKIIFTRLNLYYKETIEWSMIF